MRVLIASRETPFSTIKTHFKKACVKKKLSKSDAVFNGFEAVYNFS
jgi:hypothetical protein